MLDRSHANRLVREAGRDLQMRAQTNQETGRRLLRLGQKVKRSKFDVLAEAEDRPPLEIKVQGM